MSDLVLGGALLCVVFALGAALAVGAATRQLGAAAPVLLDLLLASGLLRLAAGGSWRALATAAAIVAVRRLAGSGVRASRSARMAAQPP